MSFVTPRAVGFGFSFSECFRVLVLVLFVALVEFVEFDRVFDRLFLGFSAVTIDVLHVLGAVVKTQRAVKTAAVASHTLEEVVHGLVEFEFGKFGFALFETVHVHGANVLDAHVGADFLDALRDTAALRENSAVERRVVERSVAERSDVHFAGVEEGLKFLERHDVIHRTARLFHAEFEFLGRTRSDKDDLCGRIGSLDEFRGFDHRRRIVRNVFCERGEILFDEHYERRTAGSGKHTLLFELVCFMPERNVRAERRFYDLMETELFDAGHDLFDTSVLELADDRGRDERVNLVLGVVFGLFEYVDGVEHERLVGNRAERALIDARAASDALVVVDAGFFVFVHGKRAHFAADYARTVLFDNRTVGTSLSTFAALDALLFIDDRFLVHDRDRAARANVLTTMNDTSAACGSNENSVDRALVAGNVDDFDDVRVRFISAERKFDTLLKYRAFLVDAATHASLGARNDFFRNVGVNA